NPAVSGTRVLIDQHARAAAAIAIHQDARGVGQSRRDRLLNTLALKAPVAPAVDDALQTAVPGDEPQSIAEVWPVVYVRFGIEQMNACQVALAPPCRGQPARAANGDELAPPPLLL